MSYSDEFEYTKQVPTDRSQYHKSNFLIGAKYKSTLLENKILALCLSHIDNDLEWVDNDQSIYCSINVSELRRLLGANGGSFYQQLNQVASAMTGKSVGMSSEDKKTFIYIAIVISAKCKDGVFTVEFNHAMRNYIKELRQNYSKLNLDIMLSFNNNYAFRLYELLKSKCYHRKGDESDSNKFLIQFKLSELKLELGIVNAELDKVKKILNNQNSPDFDLAVEKSPERSFDTWYEFRRQVLDKALKEINGKNAKTGKRNTDLTVSYEPEKKGQGGKVVGVNFLVTVDKAWNKSDKPVVKKDIDQDEVLDQMLDLFNGAFKLKELRDIAEAAEYDIDKIQIAKRCLDQSSQNIENKVGFLISAIQNHYEPSEGSSKGTGFCDTPQNDYDFEAIEKMINCN